jgi:hypothetical protein
MLCSLNYNLLIITLKLSLARLYSDSSILWSCTGIQRSKFRIFRVSNYLSWIPVSLWHACVEVSLSSSKKEWMRSLFLRSGGVSLSHDEDYFKSSSSSTCSASHSLSTEETKQVWQKASYLQVHLMRVVHQTKDHQYTGNQQLWVNQSINQ